MRWFWTLTRYMRAARFWLLLLLALAAWFGGVGRAQAQDYSACYEDHRTSAALCPDRAVAYERARDSVREYAAFLGNSISSETGWIQLSCGASTCRIIYEIFAPGQMRGERTWYIASECPANKVWDDATNSCITGCAAGSYFNEANSQCETCLSIGTKLTLFFPKSGSVGCTAGGCQISYHDTGDGETSSTQPTGANCTDGRPTNDCSGLGGNYVWNPYFNVCEPMVPECPDGQVVKQGVCVREDFCPAGQVMNEQHVCVPHEGDCPAGTSRDIQGLCNGDETQNDCPTGTVKGADGTCKPDSDADGEPDEDAENQYSGGDSCDVPPTCSGDPVMCGQARTQWRIDCNTRRNQNIRGGGCGPGDMPVCVGESCDLMEYNQLIQQWRTACAVQKLAGIDTTGGVGVGGPGEGDDEGIQGDPDFDPVAEGQAAADGLGEGDLTPEDAFTDGSENNDGAGGDPGGDGELDDSGLGLPRTCPDLPTITVFGSVVDFNVGGSVMCQWISLGGYFVLIIAGFVSVRILASGGNS